MVAMSDCAHPGPANGRWRRMPASAVAVCLLAVAGCTNNANVAVPTEGDSVTTLGRQQPGAGSTTRDTQAAGTSGAATTDDPLAAPSVEGRFAIGTDGRELALTCWGDGAPVILFDAGSGDAGIDRWKSSEITRALARRTKVCAYDRLGLGASDPAPQHPRTLDDVVDDLHLLLGAADIRGPFVLVGSSGGGFDVYEHAGRYPDDVAGLVLLDVPAGQPNIAPADVPAWDAVDNPEHMDYAAVEHQMAVGRLPIRAIPVTVVTASRGQSADPSEQKVWLAGSSRPVQVVLEGGHNIYNDDSEGVLKEILAVLDAITHA